MVLGLTNTVQFKFEVESGRICKGAHPSLDRELVLSVVIEWRCREGCLICKNLLKWICTSSISQHAKPVAFRRRVTLSNLLLKNPSSASVMVPLDGAALCIFVGTGDNIVVNEAIRVAVGKISEGDFQIRSEWLTIISLNNVSDTTRHCHCGYSAVYDFNIVLSMLV